MSSRSARHLSVVLALSAVTTPFSLQAALAQGTQAQKSPPVKASPSQAAPTTTPKSDLPAALRDTYAKARPATLRIEQCPATRCTDPDAVGTGFVISEDGLALTAYHVIFGAKSLSAVDVNRKRYPVTVVGYDDGNDVALLKVNFPRPAPFLKLADAAPKPGDPVLAIGNGGDAFLQPKAGKLVALNSKAVLANFADNTLEVNAFLIPGDSGGPIINAAGEVEGVTSYIRNPYFDEEGNRLAPDAIKYRSFAVPITAGSQVIKDLRAGVKRDAPVVGLSFNRTSGFTPEIFELFGLGTKPGVAIDRVTPGSPADQAKLRSLVVLDQGDVTKQQPPKLRADVVTAVNGKAVAAFEEFLAAVRSYKVGDTVTLTVQRGDQTLQIPITLAPRAQVEVNSTQQP